MMRYNTYSYTTHMQDIEEMNINLTNFLPHPMAMLTLNYRGSVHTIPQL